MVEDALSEWRQRRNPVESDRWFAIRREVEQLLICLVSRDRLPDL